MLLLKAPTLALPGKRGGEIRFLLHASLNPTSFTCPPNTTDYKYDIKGTLDADNQTGKKITVKSMATAAVVSKLAGNWGISVGQKSGAENIDFSPKSIDSGSKATFKFTTPWNCTNNGGNTTETYADFKLQLVIVTDNGTYTADLPTHRMKMAA